MCWLASLFLANSDEACEIGSDTSQKKTCHTWANWLQGVLSGLNSLQPLHSLTTILPDQDNVCTFWWSNLIGSDARAFRQALQKLVLISG